MNASSIQARHANPLDARFRDAFLDDLANHLQSLPSRIMQQSRHGWDINVILQLHSELGALADTCMRHDQQALSEQLLAIKTALMPAVIGLRLPDAGTTALITALASHLQVLAPNLSASPANHASALTTIDTSAAQTPANTQRVLIASLHPQRAHTVAAILTKAGFLVRLLDEPLATLEELSRYSPHCIVLDRDMPLYDGAELAEMIHERPDFAKLPVLLIADAATADDGDEVLPASALSTHLVPWAKQHIAASIDNDHAEISLQHGRYQRAWLLDRLEAALRHDSTRNVSGVLDIGIEDVSALHKRHGLPVLTAIHTQLGELLANAIDGSDMLAENGAGYLLLSRMRDADHLHALADELRSKVRNERYGPSALPITVTMGGCHLEHVPESVDAVLSAAQRARTAAADGIGWHAQEHDQITPQQLQSALSHGRLHLVFQAVVRTGASPTPHYQALLRMRDSAGYVRSAGELMPVARRAGLNVAIDGWVLDHALELLATHQRQTRPLRLFVNQSRESLHQSSYAGWLNDRLRAHDVHGARLVLTFACADVSNAPADLVTAAARIRALGVGLCLAGVEHNRSCAALLDRLPLEFIKLAPALATRPGALVPMAHARNIAVIAPQIEDHAIITQLRKIGVDYIQGHALAHPARTLNYAFNVPSQ